MKRQVPLIVYSWKVVAALMLLTTNSVSAQDRLAIRGGTIIPITGERIEGGTILISDGRIEAVGKELEIPVEAKVIDATGRYIMPGMINVHSAAGMSQANEQNSNVPFLSVVDSIDPIADFFEESRRNGVTTAAVVPGNSTMIGGRAAIVKTAGTYVNDMLVKRDAGIKISLAPASGMSRMSHFARLRRELQKAQEPEEEAKTGGEKPADGTSSEGQPAETPKPEGGDSSEAPNPSSAPSAQAETAKATREALVSLLKGEMPAIIYCETSMDVPQAIALVDEFKLKPILVLGRDCYKAAGLIADRGMPVVLDSTMVYWRTDPITRKDEKIILPKIFSDAGARFVFQTADSGTSLGTHYYWYQAATAVRYGMPVDAALKALTLDSAKLLGIEDSTGSIESGKDADLVILSGEPLSVSTWVETTIVSGKVVYQKSEDEELRLLFNPEEDTN